MAQLWETGIIRIQYHFSSEGIKYHVLVLWLSVDQIHIPFHDLENVDICILTSLCLLEFLVEYLCVHDHGVLYLENPLNHLWEIHGVVMVPFIDINCSGVGCLNPSSFSP